MPYKNAKLLRNSWLNYCKRKERKTLFTKQIQPPVSSSSYIRNCDGLTTLEWLLIVAAVAGLAALAVVLVQNVVDETAEEITGNNARVTAAQVAADTITRDARSDLPKWNQADWDSDKWKTRAVEQKKVNDEYSSKCNRLNITYADASIAAEWKPVKLATAGSATNRGSRSDESSKDLPWTTQKDEVYCGVEVSG